MVPYADPLNRSSFAFYYDFQGHQMTPIANLAVKHINNRSDILKNYTLDFIMSDTGCGAHRDVYSYAKDIAERERPLVGIVGPTCDSSAFSIVELTSTERLPLISINWGRFAVFADYKNSFGIIGSILTTADAYFKLIQKNNWKRIAMLYRERQYSREVFLELRKKISNLPGFEIAFSTPIYDAFLPLQAIRQSFIRVVFVESIASITRTVLCLAYHQGMIYPNYQWVSEFLYDSDFYREADFYYDGSRYYCSPRDFSTAVNGLLYYFIRFQPETDNMTTFSGLTYDQYLSEYKAEDEAYECSVRYMYNLTTWTNPIYDAVWALALALNSSLTELDDNNITFTNESRNRQNDITKIIHRHLLRVDFQGISGRINFDNETGFVSKTMDLYQFNDSSVSKKIGFYRSEELTILPNANPDFIDDDFPHTLQRLNTGIAVLFIIIEITALLLAIPAHVINVVYRNYMTIKASSYRLNQFVFVGCYLVVISAVFYTLSETIKLHSTTQTGLCNFILWTANTGLTLILATVCLKTWRLYYIFKKKDVMTLNKTLIKDKTLAGFILLLFLGDILIGVIWTSYDPLKSKENRTFLDVGVVATEIKCESEWTEIWLLTTVGYKGIIMLSSLTFALLTRKVNLKQFETNNVVVLVYLLSIIASISIPIYLIIRVINVGITANFIVVSILLDSAVYICLFVLFLPPIIPLFREKYYHYIPSQDVLSAKTVSTRD
jgi:gamma-aminobutyric acid type B receptor